MGVSRRHIVYGAALGGLTTAVCAAVDGIAIAASGYRVPHALVPGFVLLAIVFGTFFGAVLGIIGRRRRAFRQALFAGCALLVAAVFLRRLGLRVAPVIVLGAVVPIPILLAVQPLRKAGSATRYLWCIVSLAVFTVLWKPFNELYQAPAFSRTSLLANAGYLLLAIMVYRLGCRLPRLVSLRHPRHYWRATLAVTAVGLAASGVILSARTRRPLHRSFAAGRGAKPNVVLIVLDTVRADHLSTYGYDQETTPNLTAFAREAIRYTHAIAPAPWTLPSHASLFTGLMPTEHGGHWHLRDACGSVTGRVPEEMMTLAEVLRGHAFDTAAVVGNSVMLHRAYGLSQGFCYYDDRSRVAIDTVEPNTVSPGAWLCDVVQRIVGKADSCRQAGEINEAVFTWLDNRAGGPFFLFINYMDAHAPYRRHPEFDERLQRAVYADQPMADYDAEIAYVDHHLGRLFDRLSEGRLFEASMIIVTADHGEAFNEHGCTGHGNTLYEEEIRVPLLIRVPGEVARGDRDTPTAIASLMPCILSYLEIDYSLPVAGPNGVLAELHRPKADGDGRHWVSRLRFADNGLKVINQARRDGGTEVYNLGTDPAETNDLAPAYPELVRGSDALVRQWVESSGRRSKDPVRVNEELLRQLRSLGYVD